MWVAATKENFFDGDEENAENVEGLSFSELLLLPKAEFVSGPRDFQMQAEM